MRLLKLGWRNAAAVAVTLTLIFFVGRGALLAQTSTPAPFILTAPMSLADALNIALKQNPTVLRAQKDLEASQGVVIQTRAIAIPKLQSRGNYSAVQSSDVDKPPEPIPGFTFGTEQSWATQIRLTQSIYEGGRITSSLRAAKLTEEKSALDYQTAIADTVLAVLIAYDDVLLDAELIKVQEASMELLTRELTDTTRRYNAGTVPKFNVLRAEVELANVRPKLIRARNRYKISRNVMVNTLGFTLPREVTEEIPLNLTGKLEAEPYNIELSKAIALGLERRPELGSLRKTQGLRQEDLVNARSGYKPSLQAYAGYDAHSSIFTSDLTDYVHGWITGVELNWDLFDGFLTKGKVKEARAQFEKAGVEYDDAQRRIELEVRTAYSTFVEAGEVLKSQQLAVEQAEEAVRLASARSAAGTGTQLDLLSAQTALTDARTTLVQALYEYSVARSRLDRATGVNVPSPKSP
jgi:outer membrane protein TolC